MKVAVSSSGPTLDSEVDPRFGRCPLLLIVDTESMAFEVLENLAVSVPAAAGIQAAEAVAEEGVEAVITGDCGPKAYQALSAAGVKLAVAPSGTVRRAVEAYRQGKLPAIKAASAPLEYGVRSGWRPGGGPGGRGRAGGPGGRGRGPRSGGRGGRGGGRGV